MQQPFISTMFGSRSVVNDVPYLLQSGVFRVIGAALVIGFILGKIR